MWPVLYEVHTASGSVTLATYGLMMMLAFSAAFAWVHLRGPTVGIQPERLVPIYGAAAVGGLIGARILYVLAVTPPAHWFSLDAIFSAGGFAWYGGVIGGAAAVVAVSRALALPGWKVVDLLAPALLVGLGIGRLGCFAAGCCHGAVVPSAPGTALLPEGLIHGQLWLHASFPFLSAEFHDGVGRIHDVPLYPTQLWSSAAALGLAAVLGLVWRHRRFDGQILALMLILEPPLRIAIEAFRADTRGYVVTWQASETVAAWVPGMFHAAADEPGVMGLTTSQGIGLLMIVVGCGLWAARRNLGVAPEEPLPEPD